MSRQDNHLSSTCSKDLTVRRGNHVHLTSSPKYLGLVVSAETACIFALSMRPVLFALSCQRVMNLQKFCPHHIHKPCCISVVLSWRSNFCPSCRSSAYILIRWKPPIPPVLKLLAPELFFLILAHSVYKMWIIQEPNKLELWNKLHFKEKKTESVHHV